MDMRELQDPYDLPFPDDSDWKPNQIPTRKALPWV
jgi:hypothetical protein